MRFEKTQSEQIFAASLQGVSTWTSTRVDGIEDKRKEIERRAQERLHGKAAVERQEFADFGIAFETEEED
jgi:hypothetical protein